MWIFLKGLLTSINFWKFAIPVILILSAGGWIYHQHSVIERQKKEAIVKDITIDEQNKTIDEIKENVKQIQAVNKTIAEVNNDITKANTELVKKLSTLEKQAVQNPEATQKVINDDSVLRSRCFALATGAKPERNETNRVCPHLVKHD